jgi:hypothetical protein
MKTSRAAAVLFTAMTVGIAPAALAGGPHSGHGGDAFGLGMYACDDPYWYGADAYPYPYDDGYPYAAAVPYVPPDGYALGGLRLDVKPKSAEVMVDGHPAGIVDDFDWHFQQVKLVAGPHHIELSAPGYTTDQFNVNITADHTIQYHGTLARSS